MPATAIVELLLSLGELISLRLKLGHAILMLRTQPKAFGAHLFLEALAATFDVTIELLTIGVGLADELFAQVFEIHEPLFAATVELRQLRAEDPFDGLHPI